MEESVLVYGLGAVGAFYASLLARSGSARVSAVVRNDLEYVRAKGLTIRSKALGEQRFFLDEVFSFNRPPPTTRRSFSFILVTAKSVLDASPSLPEALESYVTDGETTIVLLTNGMGTEELITARWPRNAVLVGLPWVVATRVDPGVFEHANDQGLELGILPRQGDATSAADESRLHALAALLRRGGAEVDVLEPARLAQRRWEKLIWSSTWSACTSLAMLPTGSFLSSSPEAPRAALKLMDELISVARAAGVSLREGLAGDMLAKCQRVGAGSAGGVGEEGMRTTMMDDVRAERRTEVEALLGYPLRKARELGITTPALETNYVLLKAIDERNARSREERKRFRSPKRARHLQAYSSSSGAAATAFPRPDRSPDKLSIVVEGMTGEKRNAMTPPQTDLRPSSRPPPPARHSDAEGGMPATPGSGSVYSFLGPSPSIVGVSPHSPSLPLARPFFAASPTASMSRGIAAAAAPAPSSTSSPERKRRRRTTKAESAFLLEAFAENPFPDAARRSTLAQALGMSARTVQVWFQNRRSAEKLRAGRYDPAKTKREDGDRDGDREGDGEHGEWGLGEGEDWNEEGNGEGGREVRERGSADGHRELWEEEPAQGLRRGGQTPTRGSRSHHLAHDAGGGSEDASRPDAAEWTTGAAVAAAAVAASASASGVEVGLAAPIELS